MKYKSILQVKIEQINPEELAKEFYGTCDDFPEYSKELRKDIKKAS